MKIALAGDLHIDGSKKATCERVLRAMYDDMAARGADVLVVPGDVYDALPSPVAQLFLRSLVASLPSEIRQLYMPGNHDPPHVLGVVDAFGPHVFGGESVTVVEEPRTVDLEVGEQILRVACLPDLRATWVKKRLAGMPKGTTALDVARTVLDDLAAQMEDASGPTLFAGHLTIGGARMDNDQPARAPELAFKLSDFERVKAHAYAFGHIHLRQTWMLNGHPAFYTGSPYATNYGELSQKSWTMLHWNGVGFDVEIVPTVAPRLVLLVGTWRREGDVAEMTLAYHEAHETDRAVVLADLAGAEVQIRYETPSGDKTGAERAAEEHRAAVLAAGAVACDPDPRAAVVVRSRAPELAAARTLPEKIDAFWRAKDEWPDAARRERIHAIVARLEPLVKPPPPVSLVRIDAMRWSRLGKLDAAGVLPIRAGVQVVTGPNEAGKSTLLSLFYAGMWGDGPKGSLDFLSRGAGARLTLGVATAQGTWTLDHEVDKKTVTAWEGDEPKASGRRPYKAWAARNLPSPDVLEWTSFLPSEGKGLLGLTDAALKSALLTLAGAPIFAGLAELVAEEAKEARATTKSLADAVKRAADPASVLASFRSNLTHASGDVARKRQEIADITEALTAATSIAETEDRLRFLHMQVSELQTKREAAQHIIATSIVDVEATAAFTRANEHLAAARAALSHAMVEEDHAVREMVDYQEQIDRCQARATAERARAVRLAERLAQRSEVDEAHKALPEVATRLAAAEAAVTEAAAQQEQVGVRDTLRAVRHVASSARLKPGVLLMDRALLSIRDMADAALDKPSRATLSLALNERSLAEQEHARLRSLAEKLDELEVAAMEYAISIEQAEEEEQSIGLLTVRHQDADDRSAEAVAKHKRAADEVKRWTEERDRLAPLANVDVDVAKSQHAVGQVALLKQQEEALEEQIASITEALTVDQMHHAEIVARWPHVVPASKARLATVQHELQTAERDVVRYEDRIVTLEAAVTQLETDRAALALAERDEGDLAELLRVLSPKGIQSFEADAIGNEIADVATELLQKHGFRWMLTYAPLREDVEQARWMLCDLATGMVFDARSKGGGASGGQGFIAMCAVFWAARAALCQRGGGVPDSTATLDEMTGAVREPNVEPWLAMMRDGAERTGAKVLYLVPPNDQRLVDACDGVITVMPSGQGSIVE